ncbi:MAG: D-Ala-D-Ala carboxypeptidase family metallohydrolase [Gemmatimonadota bacterium]|jgi:uncharacterized protein YcbK (DUF882 family)|nr:D-Ala-D-Ala carboxypeptidase family metallohydrolase [Gemmatimonadota bacterium]
MNTHADPLLFPLVREPVSRWERAGLSPRGERRFNIGSTLLVALFVTGWGYAIATADRTGESVTPFSTRITTSPLSPRAPPPAPFALDEMIARLEPALASYRGASGAVRVIIPDPHTGALLPEDLPPGVELEYQPISAGSSAPGQVAPTNPGIWNVLLSMRDGVRQIPDLSVITPVPASERRSGRIGHYMIGSWPFESGGTPSTPAYAPPRGFIEVTPENRNLQVSEHFRLGDFLTKGQDNVWPKYLLLSPRLLDKLELTLQELELMGHPVENVFVVSGFRTPTYNRSGGDPRGRGALSRHMYGDAADIAIDNDRNGRMDDLNGDGRVTVADARIVAQAAERVERKHPQLIGGIGVYRPTGGHSGMVHIDTRGTRARW